jgi:hypothetical protein
LFWDPAKFSLNFFTGDPQLLPLTRSIFVNCPQHTSSYSSGNASHLCSGDTVFSPSPSTSYPEVFMVFFCPSSQIPGLYNDSSLPHLSNFIKVTIFFYLLLLNNPETNQTHQVGKGQTTEVSWLD